MLLNLSNHPSSNWPENQVQAAQQAYGRVEDMPFPQISPEANTPEIEQLADEYFQQIISKNPAAVHLMGELTFCYRLANKLKQANIPVVASTTNRQVSYDAQGNKVSNFEFVQFRAY